MTYQPGLIKQMGENAPALRIDGEDGGTMRWLQNRDTPRDATCSEGSFSKTSTGSKLVSEKGDLGKGL